MVKRCVLCGVVDEFADVSIHKFPTDVARRLQWVEFVVNNGGHVNLDSKLCSRHFIPDVDYIVGNVRRRRLMSTAVPSVAPGDVHTLKVEVVNVHMEEVDVVEVQMDDVEVVDVPMDEALVELEFVDVFDVLQPDADEEVVLVVLPRDRLVGVTHTLPECHDVGALTAVCRHCDTRHFPGKRTTTGHFSTCCNNGQVITTGDRVLFPAPYLLMNLLTSDSQDSRRYRADIRRYNNTGQGPTVFTLQVQAYYQTNNDVAVGRDEARYCELYFLESGEANAHCLDMARQRNQHELSESVMTDLDTMLQDRNLYALAFRNMRQAWQAERDLADADSIGVHPRLITMHFVADATRDQR